MLAPVNLSEVFASVCLNTWDISTILLPGGAIWVFRAILALFMDPSTRVDQHCTIRNADKQVEEVQ